MRVCVCLSHTHTLPRRRYEARTDCVVRLGGDLALVADEADELRYGEYILELEVLSGGVLKQYWVGLAQRVWRTSDGE